MNEMENPDIESSEDRSKYSPWSFWNNYNYFTHRSHREIFNGRCPKTEDFDCEVCWKEPGERKTLSGLVLKDRGRVVELNIAPRIFGHAINLRKVRGYISTIEFLPKKERFYLEFRYDIPPLPEATREHTRPAGFKDYRTDFKLFETPKARMQMIIPVKAVLPGGEMINKCFRLPNYLFISIPDEESE
jgi:hypothetical protein